MSKLFTLAEAHELLPKVEQALLDAQRFRVEYQQAEAELKRTKERIEAAGGARVDPGPFLAMRAQRDKGAVGFKDAIDRIEQLGAVVKDLDLGLVDFLTRYHQRDVYLCWKLGEKSIAFWHGLEEGFRGRKPIDREFLENHRGGEVN